MKGIDISNYQGEVDFQKVKNDGIEVVIMKATEGRTWQDTRFRNYYNGAKAAGIKVGAYHFLRGNAVEDEVNNFLSVIGGLNFDCKLIIDAEVDLGGVDTTSKHVRDFTDLLISKGIDVALYTGDDFYKTNLNDSVKNIPLWVARYSSNKPEAKNYIGWQYTSDGQVSGINGRVDMNDFSEGIFIGKNETIQNPQAETENIIDKCARYVGSRCKELQEKLITCGYNCGGYGTDGSFGPCTYNSLLAFQRDYGLSVDGFAGPATFTKLNEVVAQKSQPKPSTQYDIRYLQHELNIQCNAGLAEDNSAGPLTKAAASRVILRQGTQGNITRWVQAHIGASVDGSFGPATKSSVQTFQRNHGLDADGCVGPMTWNALLS